MSFIKDLNLNLPKFPTFVDIYPKKSSNEDFEVTQTKVISKEFDVSGTTENIFDEFQIETQLKNVKVFIEFYIAFCIYYTILRKVI